MKIAWFSPLRKTSAIGRFSALVTERIAREALVDLWVAEPESEELHATPLRIVRYPAIPNAKRMLSEYDVAIYNLGDQATYHGPIFEMSRQAPGIVILHDYVMHHFFAVYFDQRQSWDAYTNVMRRWYRADLRDTRGEKGWKVWETDEVFEYPLFEEAVAGAQGVITHAMFVKEAVSRTTGAPVTHIPLACSVTGGAPPLSRAALQAPDDCTLVVTVGHANENKRIQVVMEALAQDPDMARSILYVVVGGCEGPFGQQLLELRDRLQLGDRVRFTGYASDEALQSYLAHADFCINLRWPAMEGGSASCAEQMLYGKAIIVTDTGVYGELPDTCVRKVRPDHEAEDLAQAMRDLAGDPQLRRQLGEQARRHAEQHFTPDNYTRRLLSFCTTVAYCKPALRLIDSAAEELRRMGVTSDMEVVATVSKESALLMNGDYDPPVLRTSSL